MGSESTPPVMEEYSAGARWSSRARLRMRWRKTASLSESAGRCATGCGAASARKHRRRSTRTPESRVITCPTAGCTGQHQGARPGEKVNRVARRRKTRDSTYLAKRHDLAVILGWQPPAPVVVNPAAHTATRSLKARREVARIAEIAAFQRNITHWQP
jgi:hypothetical protein